MVRDSHIDHLTVYNNVIENYRANEKICYTGKLMDIYKHMYFETLNLSLIQFFQSTTYTQTMIITLKAANK